MYLAHRCMMASLLEYGHFGFIEGSMVIVLAILASLGIALGAAWVLGARGSSQTVLQSLRGGLSQIDST